MKLDIVLITYNQAQYIAQALDGVMMQRLNPEVEVRVIVADDASKDDTLAIIRTYEAQSPFPFIYLPQEVNMGHVLNYKRAFAACTGDYVAILEGDDWWCNPYHLQKHLDFLDEHRECVLSANRPCRYYEQTNEFVPSFYRDEHLPNYAITLEQQIANNCIDNLSTCVMRSSALQAIDSCVYESDLLDWILHVALSERGLLIYHREITSVYRVCNDGIWSSKNAELKRQENIRLLRQYDVLFKSKWHNYFIIAEKLQQPRRKTLYGRLLSLLRRFCRK